MDMKSFFSLVYEKNAWGSPESRSGAGSTLASTEHIRRELPDLFRRFNISSMLDIPCGDFNWMSHLMDRSVKYIGADIVEEIVSENIKNHPKIDFRVLDVVTADLPRVDLILCRDCFIHFPLSLIRTALKNIRRSDSKFFLTTNYLWRSSANSDIPLGKFTRVNLQMPPFGLPQPREIIPEGNSEWDPFIGKQYDRTLSLWAVRDIPEYL